MAYLIILLVISMMIGPILWLRPTPRERHLTKLRAKAMAVGMTVTCPGVQRFKWAQANKLIEKNRFVRYTFPFDDTQLTVDDFRGTDDLTLKGTYFRWIYRGEEEWQWHEVAANKLDKIPSLKALLDEITTSDLEAIAIDLSFKNCSIFWHEGGDEESVEKIKHYLDRISQLIIAEIKRQKSGV